MALKTLFVHGLALLASSMEVSWNRDLDLGNNTAILSQNPRLLAINKELQASLEQVRSVEDEMSEYNCFDLMDHREHEESHLLNDSDQENIVLCKKLTVKIEALDKQLELKEDQL